MLSFVRLDVIFNIHFLGRTTLPFNRVHLGVRDGTRGRPQLRDDPRPLGRVRQGTGLKLQCPPFYQFYVVNKIKLIKRNLEV